MEFEWGALGGRNITPNNISGVGDTDPELKSLHTPFAMSLMGYMKNRMTFNEVSYMRETHHIYDGTIITLESNQNGLAPIDIILIDGRSVEKDKPDNLTIKGYIIYANGTATVRLPSGRESGWGAIDRPSPDEAREDYINNPVFEFAGYPDFGGAKRMPLHAQDENGGGLMSNEFESLWYHDATDYWERHTTPPPEGYTWPEIYHTWEDRESPQSGSTGPFYLEGFAGGTPLGSIVRRIDGQGLWWSAPFRWTESGIEFLNYEVPQFPDMGEYDPAFGYDVTYMLPTGNFSVSYSGEAQSVDSSYWGYDLTYHDHFEYEPDIANHPEAWIPDPSPDGVGNAFWPWMPNPAWPSWNPGGEDYPVVVVHKWDGSEGEEVNSVYGPVEFPVVVPSGTHVIIHPGDRYDYYIELHTTKGVIRKRFVAEGTEGGPPTTTLSVKVGIPGTLAELIK